MYVCVNANSVYDFVCANMYSPNNVYGIIVNEFLLLIEIAKYEYGNNCISTCVL